MVHYGWIIFVGLIGVWFGYMLRDFKGFCYREDVRKAKKDRDGAYKEIDKRAHERYLARLKLLGKEWQRQN